LLAIYLMIHYFIHTHHIIINYHDIDNCVQDLEYSTTTFKSYYDNIVIIIVGIGNIITIDYSFGK